ncbi:MAG: stage V sporulation protein AC [Candidatus Improbicoccus devescovinae]|nr:MAG: stage V sporulation protein AC [Candidatus Improbicoccus devescovinae]
MELSKKEYSNMYKSSSPKSPILKDCILAFLSGGLICTLGQVLLEFYTGILKLAKEDAQTWVSITLVFLGVLLTALNIYDKIAKHAGAGTLVPITGFANSIASPAMEFKQEGHILGTGAQMFVIAGPVLVFGVIASVLYGIFVWLFKLY